MDSLLLLVQGNIASYAAKEFNPSFPKGQFTRILYESLLRCLKASNHLTGLTIAAYVGMLVGALFWGLSADVIGRKFAFNFSLMISSVFAIVAGGSPNWPVLGLFICLSAFGSGGNLVLDTAVFLEYLPSQSQWMITALAAWWGVGQLAAGLFSWAFLPNYSCATAAICTRANNMGWRYVWFADGSLVLVMSLARILVIKLRETPKFLIGEGKDAEVVDTLHFIANKYNRPCSLTLEQLEACGDSQATSTSHARSRFSPMETIVHCRGLFATKRMGLSTCLIWFSWLLIGLAYPLYNVFLPTYLATRGAEFGEQSQSVYWRNYAIANLCSIPSPILAGYMCRSKIFWGRRGTMIVGALITMAFFFAYTQVRNNAQNLAFTCCISFCLVSIRSDPIVVLALKLTIFRTFTMLHSMPTLPRYCPPLTAELEMALPLRVTESWESSAQSSPRKSNLNFSQDTNANDITAMPTPALRSPSTFVLRCTLSWLWLLPRSPLSPWAREVLDQIRGY